MRVGALVAGAMPWICDCSFFPGDDIELELDSSHSDFGSELPLGEGIASSVPRYVWTRNAPERLVSPSAYDRIYDSWKSEKDVVYGRGDDYESTGYDVDVGARKWHSVEVPPLNSAPFGATRGDPNIILKSEKKRKRVKLAQEFSNGDVEPVGVTDLSSAIELKEEYAKPLTAKQLKRRAISTSKNPDKGLTLLQKLMVLGVIISNPAMKNKAVILQCIQEDPNIGYEQVEFYMSNLIKGTQTPEWFHELLLANHELIWRNPDAFWEMLRSYKDLPRVMGREVGAKTSVYIWYRYCIQPLTVRAYSIDEELPCSPNRSQTSPGGRFYIRLSQAQRLKYFQGVRDGVRDALLSELNGETPSTQDRQALNV